VNWIFLSPTCPCHQQGDQIRRNFAYWAIAYFGQFLNLKKLVQILWQLFSAVKIMSFFGKNELDHILGDFFKSSSGHTGKQFHFLLRMLFIIAKYKNLNLDNFL
jgi:hypothetical protein